MGRDIKSVTKAMKGVKSFNTRPEMALRGELWKMGLRYRLHVKNLHGKPDIVFKSAKVAVFVDGDFWHGNQWKLRGYKSLSSQLENVSNRAYWENKIKRNMERDKNTSHILRRAGWKVLRLWESEINASPEKAAGRVAKTVKARRGR